jgi:hypothetical protein
VKLYARLLSQLDEELPEDFLLREFIQRRHEKLDAFFGKTKTAPSSKPRTKDAESPKEQPSVIERPPEPPDEPSPPVDSPAKPVDAPENPPQPPDEPADEAKTASERPDALPSVE